MKSAVLAKSFLMGAVCPLIVYFVQAAIDIITQESAAIFLMFVEGGVLLALPVFFLRKEKELYEKFPTKWIAPVCLSGYAVITFAAALVVDSIDIYELFEHRFMGGIGLILLWYIMAGGFIWAVLFRIGALIVKVIKSKS